MTIPGRDLVRARAILGGAVAAPDLARDHHAPQRPLGGVVGGLQTGTAQEGERTARIAELPRSHLLRRRTDADAADRRRVSLAESDRDCPHDLRTAGVEAAQRGFKESRMPPTAGAAARGRLAAAPGAATVRAASGAPDGAQRSATGVGRYGWGVRTVAADGGRARRRQHVMDRIDRALPLPGLSGAGGGPTALPGALGAHGR